MKTKPLYTIRRNGNFLISLDPKGQCGGPTLSGLNRFNYSCEVQAEKLDDQGFVVDNHKINDCFDKWIDGFWSASCEALAGGALVMIHKLMQGRADYISLTVSPGEHAGVTVEWEQGDELPKHLPKKKRSKR